ncbi:VanZ family protein [Streptomyces sp. ME02-6978a]|uniref:VanZ family protein n=1 Tax=Streptomyces TaxID=1883 RepID=UPI0029AE56A3|nr:MULTISPECIES: VanZ family protein [unclassified Streptomyces]MDX3091451.1 VanZ family protein [Streptomyces sp. ME12-02E]MDX3334914.1 VanZ family protein [Streptomyces sp. ME02-6978a]
MTTMAQRLRHATRTRRLTRKPASAPRDRAPRDRAPRERTPRRRAPRGRDAAPRDLSPRPLPLPLRLLAMLLAFTAMVAFAAVLARLTLEPSPASVSLTHSNLHPGRSLRAYLEQPGLRDAVKQIGGNVLLGVPFGLLLPVLSPGTRGLLRVCLVTALVMLAVELVQGALITGRAFDIDDVILNTSGALIGHLLLGRRMGRAVHARRPRPKPAG